MDDRDPRKDPRPGDVLGLRRSLIRVDSVALGEVLCAVFLDDALQPHAIVSVPLCDWTLATNESKVEDLPADDPRHTAMILAP